MRMIDEFDPGDLRPDGTMDCGDDSCRFALDLGGARTSGGCRCLDALPHRGHLLLRTALHSHALAVKAEIKRLMARVAELEGQRGHG